MSNATLTRLSEERASQEAFIAELLEVAETETRDLVDTELRSIKSAEDRISEIDAQMTPLAAFEQRRAAAVDLTALNAAPAKRQTAQMQVTEHRTLGERWVESDQFRSFVGRGSSESLNIPLDEVFQMRVVGPDPLLTTTKPGSDLIGPKYKFRAPEHFINFPLLDLVSRVEVSSNTVEWVVTSDVTGADVTAEGAAKKPVVWNTTTGTITLQTIAGWFKYSRQAAEDITGLRDLVDQKIRRAVDVKLNNLAVTALTGAKSGGNTTTGASKQPALEVIRLAMAALEGRGIMPSAVAMNPTDAASVDIGLLGQTMGGALVNRGVFGLPIIPVKDLTAGTIVVGDIGDALSWFYRNTFSLYTTDSDISDATGAGNPTSDFRHNILTTLGEVRGAFAAVDVSALEFGVVTP